MLIENLSTGKKTHMLTVHAKTLIAKGTHKLIIEDVQENEDIEVVEVIEDVQPKAKKIKK